MQTTRPGLFATGTDSRLKRTHLAVVFVAYVVVIAVAVARHEPWMDEAQAWLLAKDAGVWELFARHLRYEGSPGLWHLILLAPAKLGLPYASINVISAALTAAGVWLFLRRSPFPAVVKVLFPFTFFTLFQYGVVARSYSLLPVLLFWLADAYPKRLERPYLYALVLALLANVSTQSFLVAGSFGLFFLIDVLKGWRRASARERAHRLAALALLAAVAGLVVAVIWPPADQFFGRGVNPDPWNFFAVTGKAVAGSLVWDELSNAAWAWAQGAASLVVFLVTAWWMRRRAVLRLYLLPVLLLSALFALKYYNLWHVGILFFLWLAVLWISFDGAGAGETGRTTLLARATVASVALVLAVQVYWCAHSVGYDLRRNYSGGLDAARHIRAEGLDRARLYVSGWKAIAILPYFERNIFANHNRGSGVRFWSWSTANVTMMGARPAVISRIERERPDAVIFASDHIDPLHVIEIDGYRLAATFDGNLCWKTGLYEPDSFKLFLRE